MPFVGQRLPLANEDCTQTQKWPLEKQLGAYPTLTDGEGPLSRNPKLLFSFK